MMLTAVYKRHVLKNVLSCMSKFSYRACSTSTVSSRYPDYYLVYQYPYVRSSSIVNRLKIYQTAATLFGLPTTMGLAYFNYIATEIIVPFCAMGITGCILLYTVGFFGQNTIAFVYVNKDNSKVKIAYCDFFGRRIEMDILPDDIIPLNEGPTTITKYWYYIFARYSTKKTLKLYTKYGGILDTERFHNIFGNLNS